ncbi:DUF4291 domain-containing protein [Nonomuraea sp. PA05]|nr:DUF4291 domain-containing protein [Nonomuraea sp. PA05]
MPPFKRERMTWIKPSFLWIQPRRPAARMGAAGPPQPGADPVGS